MQVGIADLQRNKSGHSVVAVIYDSRQFIRAWGHLTDFKRALVVDLGITQPLKQADADITMASRLQRQIRVPCGLSRCTIDYSTTNADGPYCRNCQIKSAEHGARWKVDWCSGLHVDCSRVVDRNVFFLRPHCLCWCCDASSGQLKFFRRSTAIGCADEVLAGLQPEQSIFTEVIRACSLHDIQHAVAVSVRIFESLYVDIHKGFAVTIEYTAGNRSGRHDLNDNVGHA